MALNPDILKWARTSAGLTLDQAATTLGFKDTQARSAADRLRALEEGEEAPSRSVILKMVKVYRRSLLVFYLSEPPRKGDRGRDFRTVPGAAAPHYDPILDALIRDIRGRQTIVRSLLEESDAPALDFIGSATMKVPAAELARRITEKIAFSLAAFRSRTDVDQAFNYLRECVERSRIFVLLIGNLGSHHTNISVEAFRGFAIADPVAPFVVINDRDARAAWAFTTFHELVHLWLGTTGVSGSNIGTQIESYCNDIAGEILLPDAEVRELSYISVMRMEEVVEALSLFAQKRRVSRAMVAYRLLRAKVISDARWRDLSEYFRREWLESAARHREAGGSDGGPSYYVVRRHRLGHALLGLVSDSLGEGLLTHTKAGQVLGVKPRNVEPLLHPSVLQGGGR